MKNDNPFNPRDYSKRIGIFEIWLAHRRGIHDGRLELPRQNNSGGWSSAQIEQEFHNYDELAQRVWRYCEEITTHFHIEVSKLQFRLKQLNVNFDGIAEYRYHNEEIFGALIIKGRLQKERTLITEMELRLVGLIQQIAEIENQARFICEQYRCCMAKRLSAYWSGCLKSNSESKKLPPAPPTLSSSAESIYRSRHKNLSAVCD